MKKIKMAGALLAAILSMSTSLSADMKQSVKPNGCKGPVLCPSFPIYGRDSDCCDRRWHLDIGLLWEQPWMENMTAGMKSTGNPLFQTSTADYQSSSTQNLEQCFDYSPGITASFGHLLNHDNWFVGIDFNWLSASMPDKSFSENNATYNVSIGTVKSRALLDILNATGDIASDGLPSYYLELIFNANINIYDVDFILSRGSYHSKCFSYEPFAAIKALWYDGKYNTQSYNNVDNSAAGGSAKFAALTDYLYTSYQMNAWGVGPEFGFNGEYHITEGLSIFSDSQVAVLYGEMRATYGQQYVLAAYGINEAQTAYKENSNQQYFVPVQSKIGVKLAQYCMEDKHYVALKIGYDAQYVFSGSAGSGDIARSGLYLNFEWDF